MTSELTVDSPGEAPKQIPSTAGMTTKVVKGSMWTLAGSVAPLGVSLFTTPLVIRMLGAESYGVLVLVALIPVYLGFADFGMSVASTKFAAQAYGEGDLNKEALVVQTATLIALCTSVPVATLLILSAGSLVIHFNVPEHLLGDATLAIRLASVTFVINILSAIANSPQLARLRMDLTTLVNGGSRILGLIAVPIVIYLGYGVVGAVSVLLAASFLSFGAHVLFASRLVKGISRIGFSKIEARAMMNFGGHLVIAAAAAMVVANIEKALLPSQVSVEALAYYTVAFTLASMMTLFSQAMIQSLVPSFSQLQGPTNREQLNGLYTRGLRLNLIVFLPTIAILIVVAKPFLTVWAGPEYADHGIVPFFILLAGLVFNLPAFLPYAVIMAAGRSSIFAKLYVAELVPYVFVVYYLTSRFGIVGAATAWSLRVAIDAVFQFYFARRFGGIPGKELKLPTLVSAGLAMIVPIIASTWFDSSLVLTITLLLVSVTGYAVFVWSKLLDASEIQWMKARMHQAIAGFQ